jgi:hypothetical protein
MKKILIFTIIALAFFASCKDKDDDDDKGVQRQYTLTLRGKTVTVIDARTNPADQDLEQLGVMTKLRAVIAIIESSMSQLPPEYLDAYYDTVLERGLVIEFNGPGAVDEFSKTRGNNTILLTIDGFLGYTDIYGASQIATAIVNYLAEGIDKDYPKEFPITSGEYTVIIKDGRTVNPADQDLAELGVITKFEALINFLSGDSNAAYNLIISRGLMVVVESGVEYDYYRAIDGNTVGANLSWILETVDISIPQQRNRFVSTLSSMDPLDFTQR